ncbi:MAG: hypothetical protein HY754_00290 [Nitrospirae bacterium]|nr:hypothetical protein [Nitrospirota bacterium]
MRKILFISLPLLFIFVLAQNVIADPIDDIAHRLKVLQDRLNEGKISGELAPPEAKSLQKRLDDSKRHFEKVIRRVPPPPPPKINEFNRKLDVLEKDIFKKKHNPVKR